MGARSSMVDQEPFSAEGGSAFGGKLTLCQDFGSVAQLVEQQPFKLMVVGSIPTGPKILTEIYL